MIAEASEALEKEKYIPVIIGNTKPPLLFRRVQGVIWNDDYEITENKFNDLVKQIKRLLGEPRVTSAKESNFLSNNDFVITMSCPISSGLVIPVNPSTGGGVLTVSYKQKIRSLTLEVDFRRLLSGAIAANLHGPAREGFNAPVQISLVHFPLGTSGGYSNIYYLSPEQEAQLIEGLWYINICTKAFPNGEIRGQIYLL